MFYTGLRPGEDIEIKTSDLKGNYINVTKTISSHKKREISTPKTFSSMRKVKISRFLVKDLKKIIKNYKKGAGDLFLFGGVKPLSPTSIKRRKISTCKKANLRTITLHQFRHSHATMLLTEGIIINEVSRRLGHSRVSTTLDVYTHTSLEQKKSLQNSLFQTIFHKPIIIIYKNSLRFYLIWSHKG
jgi:phage integrase